MNKTILDKKGTFMIYGHVYMATVTPHNSTALFPSRSCLAAQRPLQHRSCSTKTLAAEILSTKTPTAQVLQHKDPCSNILQHKDLCSTKNFPAQILQHNDHCGRDLAAQILQCKVTGHVFVLQRDEYRCRSCVWLYTAGRQNA